MSLAYAIADIHGRADLLDRALALIDAHAAGRERTVLFLGDYVDRGPASRAVIERLMPLTASGRAICIKGNHEAMMVEALRHATPSAMARWSVNGGAETLRSYGALDHPDPASVVPASHVDWMATLPVAIEEGGRVFVHAGLEPRTPLDEQEEPTCLWIRERFLRAPAADLPAHVVHGHTPIWKGKPDAAEPELLPHRTNLDTAAFATGVLAIGVFGDAPGGPVEVLFARAEPHDHSVDEVRGPRPPRRRSLIERIWPRANDGK